MYELNILRWLVDAIPNTPKGFQLSAYLESFAIHLRGLIDFLYTDPKDAKPDDVIADDFFDMPDAWNPGAMSLKLNEARKRTNKEVGHITYQRNTGMDPSATPLTRLFRQEWNRASPAENRRVRLLQRSTFKLEEIQG